MAQTDAAPETITPSTLTSPVQISRGESDRTFRAGWLPVFHKELADHFSSRRFLILFLLVVAASLAALYVAAQTIRGSAAEAGETGFVFLLLYTTTDGSMPSLIQFLGFLGPLAGLALGFDAINGEWSRRTLSRVLSQPIHRDAVINGKFLAGFTALGLIVLVLGLLVAGMGLRLIGVPPTGEEAMRILVFLILTVFYVGFWLALSILFSLLFRQAATSALAGMSVWLLFVLFWQLLAGLAAEAIAPISSAATVSETLANQRWFLGLSRLSPAHLYSEATATILRPDIRAIGPVLSRQVEGAVPGAPLPLEQSLLLITPHLVGMIAACMICFALAYILFMRQEIRAN